MSLPDELNQTLGSHFYRLVNREVVACTVHDWIALGPSAPPNQIAQEIITDFRVSTIFQGSGPPEPGDLPPLLFETMVFGISEGRLERLPLEDPWRYSTYEEALEGHAEMCQMMRRRIDAAESMTVQTLRRIRAKRQ